MKRSICILGLLLCLALPACTPLERSTAVNDVSKIAADFAMCVKSHASDPSASIESVATTCGAALVPDIMQFIADELAAIKKGHASPDAGAP